MSEEEVLERKWGVAGRKSENGCRNSGSWSQSPWDPSRSLPLPRLVTLNER